jgi:intracellular sulfur oxidation DsrE/DsrF family protein
VLAVISLEQELLAMISFRKSSLLALSCLALAIPVARADAPPAELKIDVAVTLESAKVVFNMDHLAFQGDLPVGMKYMDLFSERMKEQHAPARIVGVFHGNAGYMLLNDAAYNSARKVSTGNPFKQLVSRLMEKGVQIEECVVTMKGNGWANKDLLPGVKVNSGAVIRLVQLHQEGYAEIQP